MTVQGGRMVVTGGLQVTWHLTTPKNWPYFFCHKTKGVFLTSLNCF